MPHVKYMTELRRLLALASFHGGDAVGPVDAPFQRLRVRRHLRVQAPEEATREKIPGVEERRVVQGLDRL